MKIALCFSGQIRDFASTLPSFKKHILSRLCGHDVFLFCHTPGVKRAPTSFGLHFTEVIVEHNEPSFFPRLRHLPTHHDVECRPWNQSDPLTGYVRQLRSIYISNFLQQKYSREHSIRFDLVFRLRFDNLYIHPLDDLSKINFSYIYLPAHDGWNGCNDRFAFGHPDIMNVYCSRFCHLHQYLNDGLFVHPETLLATHLDLSNVQVRHSQVVHHLYRHGTLTKACFKHEHGDNPAFTPEQPFMRWRFQVKKRLGDDIYNQLAILWWKLGI